MESNREGGIAADSCVKAARALVATAEGLLDPKYFILAWGEPQGMATWRGMTTAVFSPACTRKRGRYGATTQDDLPLVGRRPYLYSK